MSDILEHFEEMLKEDLKYNGGREVPTEICHPTDLITSPYYYELTYILMLLKVLPEDVHLMGTRYWSDYDI